MYFSKTVMLSLLATTTMFAGCASNYELRSGSPFKTYQSKKTARDLSACVADEWEKQSSHFTVSSRHTEKGYVVSLSEDVLGSKNSVYLAEVDDINGGSKVSLFKGTIVELKNLYESGVARCI